MPPAGFEPALPPPEGGALSPELWGPWGSASLLVEQLKPGSGCRGLAILKTGQKPVRRRVDLDTWYRSRDE